MEDSNYSAHRPAHCGARQTDGRHNGYLRRVARHGIHCIHSCGHSCSGLGDQRGFYSYSTDGCNYSRSLPAFILNGFLDLHGNQIGLARSQTQQLAAGRGCIVKFGQPVPMEFDLSENDTLSIAPTSDAPLKVIDMSGRVDTIQRCTRCILPVTYPFIEFDAEGVCQYCRGYEFPEVSIPPQKRFSTSTSADGSADCIVAFSGGRDSSYGLHLIKKIQHEPYRVRLGHGDGGRRRNQARMLGQLGIEHILRAEDIPAKRRYMRKNIEASVQTSALGHGTLVHGR